MLICLPTILYDSPRPKSEGIADSTEASTDVSQPAAAGAAGGGESEAMKNLKKAMDPKQCVTFPQSI